MLTANQTSTEIRNLIDLLVTSGTAIFTNRIIQSSGAATRITWAHHGASTGVLFRGDFCTIDDYRNWILAGAYSAILFDGSIIQLTYDFEYADLIRHRLAYYPCPFDIDQNLLREEPILDVIDMFIDGQQSLVRLRSPLRFDYDAAAQGANHPASHLTLLSPDCRWPVVAPLSPGHFIRFIFHNFYPLLWANLEFIRNWPQRLGDRTITTEEESHLHISCARS